MKNLILLAALFCCSFIYAQDIATDSKNKGVFSYYSTKKYRAEFSSKDFSLTFSSLPIKINFLDPNDDINVIKKSNYFFQVGMINSTDILSLSDFSDVRPGGRMKIGYQRVVDSISANYGGLTYAFGGNVFTSIDNIKIFSADKSVIEKKYPFSYGVELNYTQFFPSPYFTISITSSISKGWNENALLNYKDISSNSVYNGNIVAFEKFDGKYGIFKNNLTKFRFSLAAPIAVWYLNPTPYFVLNSISENKPTYTSGIYLNFLAKKINFHSFKVPSSFGFGVDKTYQNDAWGDTKVFLRGSINIGEH